MKSAKISTPKISTLKVFIKESFVLEIHFSLGKRNLHRNVMLVITAKGSIYQRFLLAPEFIIHRMRV